MFASQDRVQLSSGSIIATVVLESNVSASTVAAAVSILSADPIVVEFDGWPAPYKSNRASQCQGGLLSNLPPPPPPPSTGSGGGGGSCPGPDCGAYGNLHCPPNDDMGNPVKSYCVCDSSHSGTRCEVNKQQLTALSGSLSSLGVSTSSQADTAALLSILNAYTWSNNSEAIELAHRVRLGCYTATAKELRKFIAAPFQTSAANTQTVILDPWSSKELL